MALRPKAAAEAGDRALAHQQLAEYIARGTAWSNKKDRKAFTIPIGRGSTPGGSRAARVYEVTVLYPLKVVVDDVVGEEPLPPPLLVFIFTPPGLVLEEAGTEADEGNSQAATSAFRIHSAPLRIGTPSLLSVPEK